MSTVDWTASYSHDGEPKAEGLRERKKRLMRQQLTDVATRLFLERGFDGVRVAEVAEACGVSEKTVFNYFPTKESLLLDRFDTTMTGLHAALVEPQVPPVQAVRRVLDGELDALVSWLTAQQDRAQATAGVMRFNDMIESTPSLRAHQREMTDRLAAMAAEVLAERAGLGRDDPEPAIAAIALLGLWQIQSRALRRHLDATHTPVQLREAVTAEVHRAAELLDAGLRSFASGAAVTSRSSSRG